MSKALHGCVLFIAYCFGIYLDYLSNIFQNVVDKNPMNEEGMVPLHYSAENSHLIVSEFIIENAVWKNPKDNDGWTPLHASAQNGHLNVCELIT